MDTRVETILKQMTLEEKAGLCSGLDAWHLKPVNRLDVPSVMLADGPHGLRKQRDFNDYVGLTEPVAATCFPPACTTACSWDLNLLNEIGAAMAEECLQEEVSVILGPGANIKRSPLCGRNFEYFSEDPYLSGKLAAAMINGIQSTGVGASLKHYAMNNQETRRMSINAVVDERAKREIYLKSFEIAVKESQPRTVMCAYNRIDGEYAAENKRLLTEILRDEWGFNGIVISDWGATNDRVEGVKAGLDLEMPDSRGKNDEKIAAAVNNGSLSIEALDAVVRRLLVFILDSNNQKQPNYQYNQAAHHTLARKAAAESAVLLKNNGILPLSKTQNIAIIGAFAKTPRYQGAGSSLIKPHHIDTFCGTLDHLKVPYTFAPGYNLESALPDAVLIEDAVSAVKGADVALVFAGLPDAYESEGFDRTHISMPESHNALIRRILEANPHTVIVLMNGSAVSMPWAEGANAILACHLGGEAGGCAAVDVLFGDVNPSGKLAETYPFALEDTPSFLNFPGFTKSVEYRESIYVGYRYYDKAGKSVRFPFGHGLSYTTFAYSNLSVKADSEIVEVTLKIKNTGRHDGAEVVQLYVKNSPSVLFKPVKELRAFQKVWLKSGETTAVSFSLSSDAFSYYNVRIKDWHVEAGTYEILIGSSSRDIRLSQPIAIKENKHAEVPNDRKRLPDYYELKEDRLNINAAQFEMLYGPLPERERLKDERFALNTTLDETKSTFVGWLFQLIIKSQTKKMAGAKTADNDSTYRMMLAAINEMPIRAIGQFAGDMIPRFTPEALVCLLNHQFFKGIKYLLKK